MLDPFCGSGTTGVVARQEGRRFVGVELSEQYCAMARDRIEHYYRRDPPTPAGAAYIGQPSLFAPDHALELETSDDDDE